MPIEKDLQHFFGYLQIGEIKKVDQGFDIPKWMVYHPHTNDKRRNNKTNTIYIARDNLSWNSHFLALEDSCSTISSF